MELKREDQAFRMRDENGVLFAEVTFPAYAENEDVWEINHTWVDPSLRGQGIASQLLIAVDEAARQEGKLVVPTCSYAVTWYKRHEDKQEILAKALD